MDSWWTEIGSKAVLYVYLVGVAIWLAILAVRSALRKGVPRSEGERLDSPGAVAGTGVDAAPPPIPRTPVRSELLSRLVVEYVGNASHPEATDVWGEDRRRNLQARILMDHVKQEALARNVPAHDVERLVEALRRTMQAEGQEPQG